MKSSKLKYLLIPILVLSIPTTVKAISYNSSLTTSSVINFNAIIQSGAVVNDASNNSNFNFVIIGMIVVIIVLVGAAMFAPKK